MFVEDMWRNKFFIPDSNTTCFTFYIHLWPIYWLSRVHTAERLVPDPSPFKVEVAIAKLKRHKSPGSEQFPAELIQAGCETLRSGIHKLINSIWNKEELHDQWKESIIVLYFRIYHYGGPGKPGGTEIKWDKSAAAMLMMWIYWVIT
jgi:hypothetical protein